MKSFLIMSIRVFSPRKGQPGVSLTSIPVQVEVSTPHIRTGMVKVPLTSKLKPTHTLLM